MAYVLDELTARNKGLHRLREGLGVKQIDMLDRPGGGVVVNVSEYKPLNEKQRTAIEDELTRQTGFKSTVVMDDQNKYLSRIEVESPSFADGATKLAALNNTVLEQVVKRHAGMAVAH